MLAAVQQISQHCGSQEHTKHLLISPQKLLNLQLQRSKPKGERRLLPQPSPRPYLACFSLVFFSPHFTHSRLTLASHQIHQAQRAADSTGSCGDMQGLQQHQEIKRLTALCQVFPVILYFCNLNLFYKTTLSPSWELSCSQQISQGQTLNQDKLLSAWSQ